MPCRCRGELQPDGVGYLGHLDFRSALHAALAVAVAEKTAIGGICNDKHPFVVAGDSFGIFDGASLFIEIE